MIRQRKITLKNALVYDFMRKHADKIDDANVKAIFTKNKVEIAKKFAITTYAAFNFHVRKCIDWEMATGNSIKVYRMDNGDATNE